ncbi:MAG: hypothetical protein WCK36_03995 [Candidatus Firestonebacteria bacterium]
MKKYKALYLISLLCVVTGVLFIHFNGGLEHPKLLLFILFTALFPGAFFLFKHKDK